MSKQAVEAVMGKVILDVEFSHALLADPDGALARFDLTEGEKTILKSMDSETLDFLAMALAERIPALVKYHRLNQPGHDPSEVPVPTK